MNEPTEEQIKELWEWCGFGIDGVGIWHCPDGITELGGMPKVTLDNLFKWAVPKVIDMEKFIKLETTAQGRYIVKIYPNVLVEAEAKEYREDPALALFWAIYKVIKEQK